MAKRDYLVEAAKQFRMALDSEVSEDYEAAFSYYKNGVDLLLNGVQLDPNKDRREAVKRKTTQYLKRAEEIFITHLQDNLVKGSSHLGGYSSLRFRPIRHLSSPVEDLDMCKVVGVADKVLVVQSMVNKETFVVKVSLQSPTCELMKPGSLRLSRRKLRYGPPLIRLEALTFFRFQEQEDFSANVFLQSLVKSSWESRDQPTIIPQGVPYMVKLLRYYVSEDAVYLHLEHVKGGRLFSKLHKLRNEKAREHPECLTSGQHSSKLKSSYTSPTISTDYQHNSGGSTGVIRGKSSDESPDAEFPASWDETQRLESCRTHSYIEETGCLQNTRSAASFHSKLERLTLYSGSSRSQVNARIHPPAPSLCLHSSETQEHPALPLPCARVSLTLNSMSEVNTRKAAMGLTECSSEFEEAWKAADPSKSCERLNPYAVTDGTLGKTTPHTNQTSFLKTGSAGSSNNALSSSPAVLHLPLHCQTQIHGKASWDNSGSHQVSAHSKQDSISPTPEEKNGVIVIRSTDRAVFSDHADTRTASESTWSPPASLYHSITGKQWTFPGLSPALSGGKSKVEAHTTEAEDGLRDARESHPREGVASAKERSFVSWFSSGPPLHTSKDDKDIFQKLERTTSQEEDQIIEVDGWCHLPRFPVKSSPTDKALQNCWGLPEAEVRVWGAQILLALESLHQQGVLCRDLNPRNVLLTSNGKVCLTFFGQWSEVQSEICCRAMDQMYCAPEIGGVSRITEACDWWSLGALLFELLTGMPLWQLHPAGIHSHTQLLIPDHLSTAAASLLTELLQFDAGYRLGSGGGGVCDIKCHPFFSSVSWKALSC